MRSFPVTVTMDDGTVHTRAKLVNDGDSTQVYVWDAPSSTAVCVVDVAQQVEPNGWQAWKVEGVFTANAAGGCGCGHPLKRWQPPAKPPTVRAG